MIEYRFVRSEKPSADEGNLHGKVAPFNSWTKIGGDKWGFRERIAPGTFKKSINDGDVVLLDNHDTAKPIARASAGTLQLNEKRDSGLHYEATPADTTYAQDVVKNVRAGNYGGMSFGFEILRDSWKKGENGGPDERTIHEVRLHEISVVTFPAYKDTDVNARDSIAAAREARERALGPIDEDAPETDAEDRGGDAPGDGSKPYGKVVYADPKNGKYPVNTKKRAKAAWDYISQKANADKYPLNGVTLASVVAKIRAACKKFGVQISEKNDELALEAADYRELALALTDADLHPEMREMITFALRGADEDDPYADEFYERDKDDKSDASGSDAGGKKCAACGDTGKDKSGNKCATCGGSKGKNGDGKMHESPKGDEKKSGEPDSSTRTDEDRRDALRKHKANMRREQLDRENQ